MPEGFDPSEAPVRRGRRDPQLAAAMLEDDQPLGDAGETTDQSYVGLAPGDTVMGKVTFASTGPLGDAWYTFGSQSQVLAGETGDAAIERLADVIGEGVLDIASAFSEKLDEQLESQREAARHRRITPQQ